jgi:hypothetical protein
LKNESPRSIPVGNGFTDSPSSLAKSYSTAPPYTEGLELVGFQFATETIMTSDNDGKPEDLWEEALSCSYHRATMLISTKTEHRDESLQRQDNAENGNVGQPAIFIRADTGELSTARDCRCLEILQKLSVDICTELIPQSS